MDSVVGRFRMVARAHATRTPAGAAAIPCTIVTMHSGHTRLLLSAVSLARTGKPAHVPEVTMKMYDFRHSPGARAFRTMKAVRQSQWLKLAAIGTWAVCGMPAMAAIGRRSASGSIVIFWAAAFAAYGAALVVALWRRDSARRFAIALVALQSITAIVMTDLAARHMAGTGVGLLTGIGLMVIVAAQLPHLVTPAATWSWIGAQTIVMTLFVDRVVAASDVITFALGAAGFQMFACMTTALMLREASARAEVARANDALHATRALLAENSRAAERLRIARDLHDSLGHHLMALSLQLDIASRLAAGAAAEHVGQAHGLTRLLLAEVRSVVGQMRDGTQTDVAQAIRALAATADGLDIHLDIPERLTLDDGAQAMSILRCVQEVITNTSRHANARNLWIRIHAVADGIELHARDDGRGTATVECGNGLTGIRERFAEYSGRVEFGAGAGRGFEIHGFMPTPQVGS
jgi:signal transduction histidine kinase